MTKKLTCKDCGTELLKLSPPLRHRRGADGQPMTRAEAIHLFVDSRGGRDTDSVAAPTSCVNIYPS